MSENATHMPSADPFQGYRVDHLLMLVGGNPLPNAVAAPLLTRPNARLTLLHSIETATYADRIVDMLPPTCRIQPNPVLVDVSDRVDIETKIATVLEKEAGTCGLHYTGGTKSMSVHAFRAVEAIARARGIDAVFSYLDSRKLVMMIDVYEAQTRRVTASPRPIPVGPVKMKLKDMLALHDWKFDAATDKFNAETAYNGKPILPLASQAIAAILLDKYARNLWEEVRKPWVRDHSKPTSNGNSTQWTPANIEIPAAPEFAALRRALAAEASWQEGKPLSTQTAAKAANIKHDDFCEWLKAKWMETLAYSALQACQSEFGLTDICQSLRPYDSHDKNVNFELDCVALRGHQLFAISCTADSNQVANQHLFEIYVRARQIGGDEACLALVCLHGDTKLMERKIRKDLDAGVRIKVFGKDHLTDLEAQFRRWIEGAVHRGGAEENEI